jgi:hypothetical protein
MKSSQKKKIFHNPRVFTRQLRDLTTREGVDEDWIELPANPKVRDTVYAYKIRSTKTPSARREPAQSVFTGDGALARSTPTPGCDDRSRRDERARKIPTHRSYDERIDRHRRDRSRPVAHSTSSWKRISTPPRSFGTGLATCLHRASDANANERSNDAKKYSMKYVLGPWSP